MADGDVYEISLDQDYAGQKLTNVLNFVQVGSNGTGSARDSLNILLGSQMQSLLTACWVDTLTYTQTRCRRIYPTESQAKTRAVGVPGDVVTVGMPPHLCAILRQYGTRSDRRGIGHMKMAGMSVANVNEGRIDQTLWVLYQNLAAVLVTDTLEATLGWTWRNVVWSKLDNVVRKVQVAGPTGTLKTVRSRQIGLGQ